MIHYSNGKHTEHLLMGGWLESAITDQQMSVVKILTINMTTEVF